MLQLQTYQLPPPLLGLVAPLSAPGTPEELTLETVVDPRALSLSPTPQMLRNQPAMELRSLGSVQMPAPQMPVLPVEKAEMASYEQKHWV